jgi:hypothetical protein
VLRRCLFLVGLCLALAPDAAAQMAPEAAEDAGKSETAPRPPPGPSVRERGGGRRSRGASTASGALIVVVIVVGIGHFVWKKVRRRY